MYAVGTSTSFAQDMRIPIAENHPPYAYIRWRFCANPTDASCVCVCVCVCLYSRPGKTIVRGEGTTTTTSVPSARNATKPTTEPATSGMDGSRGEGGLAAECAFSIYPVQFGFSISPNLSEALSLLVV